ncbi:MAG: hypothetical protein ABI488_11175, partial [Polyangiaceae bacterium]
MSPVSRKPRAVQKSAAERVFQAFASASSAPVFAGLCALGLVLCAPGGHAQSKPARVAVATENALSS